MLIKIFRSDSEGSTGPGRGIPQVELSVMTAEELIN